MNNNQTESRIHSSQFLRKRKMMLAYPLLVLPFITMIFWALGGGTGDASKSLITSSGLNMQLPNAHLKDDNSDTKLSYYEEADKNLIRMGTDTTNTQSLEFKDVNDTSHSSLTPYGSKSTDNSLLAENYGDRNEEKVYQKLAELNQQLSASPKSDHPRSEEMNPVNNYASSEKNNEAEKLDRLMKTISNSDNAADPEMNDLNKMMDKILDIQHPERVQKRQDENTFQDKENTVPVNTEPIPCSISLLETSVRKQADNAGFFGLEENESSKDQNAIEAVVHDDQTLVNGSVIKLRTANDISVNGNKIPKGNFISGIVSLNGERLQVEVSSIKYEQNIFPVKLTVYDMDGLPGIYIPGAITRDVAKESVENATQMMEISSMDPSVKAQAASAGISAVKALLSKKMKMVRVAVKAGYKILLR